jgi:hypothetical protein
VLGKVNKPGGYVIGSGGGATVFRVVAAAGGHTRDASMGRTKMLRRTPNRLQEIPVPLKNLLSAKAVDMELDPDDIVFVPNSRFNEIVNGGALATSPRDRGPIPASVTASSSHQSHHTRRDCSPQVASAPWWVSEEVSVS